LKYIEANDKNSIIVCWYNDELIGVWFIYMLFNDVNKNRKFLIDLSKYNIF